MSIKIVSEGRLVDIAADGFDYGIRAAERVPTDMVAAPIRPMQQHIVVAAPSYLNAPPPLRAPADFSHHRGIQLRMPSGLSDGFVKNGHSSIALNSAALADFGDVIGLHVGLLAPPTLRAPSWQDRPSAGRSAYP